MAEVVIDGITYIPEGKATPKVGIAITVRDRLETTLECLAKVKEHTPANIPIIIVDDASQKPYPDADYRFDQNVGIPRAKNKCLELLMDLGCEYLILLDNDCYPLRDDWVDVFVRLLDKHPHLSAQFRDLKSTKQLGDVSIIYGDDEMEVWTGQRGYCLAYRRDVIEKIGGFDPIYGKGLYEHSDLANRMHAAELTTWRYAAPRDSHLLMESLDQSLKVTRTPLANRDVLVKTNAAIHNERRDSGYTGYVEYREQRDIVLTCLYTGTVDPQRGKKMTPDIKALSTLVKSAQPHQVVVQHDELADTGGLNVELVKSPNSVNVYFQRWINALAYLQEHPEIRNALVCDGTDVEILQPDRLFAGIDPEKLYVGSEFQVVGSKWLIDNHPHPGLQEWMKGNTQQLLNAGVVFGHRDMVMRFLRGMVHVWEHIESEKFHTASKGNGIGDMAVFNYMAYNYFGDRLVYGPQITTLFKSEQANDFSLIRHK